MGKTRTIRGYLERIEDNQRGVIELENEVGETAWIEIPMAFLPSSSHENAVLDITMTVNEKAEEEALKRVEDLQNKLFEKGRRKKEQ